MTAAQKTAVAIGISMLLLSGCFVRKRVVFASGSHPNHPALTATKEELVQRIHNSMDPIGSFLARVNMSASTTTATKDVVTDYATIRGYIVYQRPDLLRIIGQDPVMNNTIFDMASMGPEFRMLIPGKSRFIVGHDESPSTSEKPLENLRPAAFLTALLIAPPAAEKDIVLLEDDSSGTKAIYILLIIRRDGDGYTLFRNVYFDRYSLQIISQKTFDPMGRIVSETAYANWKNYGRAAFPSNIDIKRPLENYEVQVGIVSMRMNSPDVTREKFLLDQPPGTLLQRIE